MRPLVLAGVLLVTACAPVTAPAPPSASPSASASATASAQAEASTAPPSSAPPARAVKDPVGEIKVDVTAAPFGIVTDLMLRPAAIDGTVTQAASTAVALYLMNIDAYRDGSSPALPITGPFLEAVSAALRESATPGVKRQFELVSLKVDRHFVKPWGTHAYVDVTVTIADRAVGGTAPDQFETGKLRLSGDRFRVTDGWDEAHDRWFNGFPPLSLSSVRDQVGPAIAMYLRMESWTVAEPPLDWRTGSDALPFQRARAAKLDAIDRSRITSRLFDRVTATVERFDTIEGLWSGLATVRVAGTLITAGADGVTQRAAFERQMKVFMFGGWLPEVVDEEATPGVWLSGGDLALDQVDINRA